MEIRKLEWDSLFFGFFIGDVFIENNHPSNSVVFNSEFYTFIQVRSKSNFNIFSDTHSVSYSEIKIVFSKKIDQVSEIEDDVKDFDDFPIEEKTLYELAYESGKYSRYKQDENISDFKFKEFYRLWISNSINKSFADKIFYISENENILGFVTLKIKDGEGFIGLIAVSSNFQGKGLGKKLLLKAENYCFLNNVNTLHIPTQFENIPACNFYRKLGYEISEKINVKHFWINNNKLSCIK